MPINARLDENSRATLTAVSSTGDGSIVQLYANPVTHRLLVDATGGGGSGITSINGDTTAAQIFAAGTNIIIVDNGTGTHTISSTGGGGGVSTVSVVTANGFAGTVANPTSTPAITLTTSVTGLLKGNGTAISAATAGTDYQAPITLTTTGSSGPATFAANTLNIPQYTGGGGTATFVNNEIVSGSGSSFTLANTPVLGTQDIYANGQRLIPGGVDYTISGASITMVSSWSAGTVLADYQTASGGGVAVGTWYQDETPTGTLNGTNAVFTLAHTPLAIVFVYINGQYQASGSDYTRSGTTITFVTAPHVGDILRVNYQ